MELEEKKRKQRKENEQREKQLLDELKKREDEIKAIAEKENAKKLQQYEEQKLRELKEENERKEKLTCPNRWNGRLFHQIRIAKFNGTKIWKRQNSTVNWKRTRY